MKTRKFLLLALQASKKATLPKKELASELEGADALVLMTAHREFRELDLPRVKECMRTPIIIDGRRVFEQEG